MGIVRKEEHLREIAAMIGKGGFEFSTDSRPSMDGGRAFIGSVSYDPDRGGVNYTLCNEKGDTLVSAHGVRMLEQLPSGFLKEVKSALRAALDRQQSMHTAMERSAAAVRRNAGMVKGL